MKNRLLAAISVAILATLTGCADNERDHPGSLTTAPATKRNSTVQQAKLPAPSEYQPSKLEAFPKPTAEIMVSAQQLAKEYMADPEAAALKHQGKFLRIDGTVLKVRTSESGVKLLELAGEGDMHIECGMAMDATLDVDAIKEGQNISLVGKVYGKLGSIISLDFGEVDR